MMEVGREEIERFLVAMDSMAESNRELIRLATEERIATDTQPGPPYCPHCGHFSPPIRVRESGGPMADMIITATCQSCGNTFFGVAEGWLVFTTSEEAQAQLEGREDDFNR